MDEQNNDTTKKLKNSLLILICILVLVIIVLMLPILVKVYTNQKIALNKTVSTAAVNQSQATVNVNGVPPTASTATLNGNTTGDGSITLIENSTTGSTGATEVTVGGTVHDANGCKALTDVTVKVYEGNLSDCTATNGSTCYVLDDSSPATDATCTGPSVLDYTVNDLNHPLAMEYYSLPGTWHATIIPSDHAGVNADGEATSSGTALNSLTALSVTSTIAYGTVANNAYSTGDHKATVTNTGNTVMDYNLSGEDLHCTTFGSIPVGNQEYSLSSFSYEATPSGGVSALSSDPALLSAAIAIATGTASTKDSYWQISVPFAVVGTCSGNVTFAAAAH